MTIVMNTILNNKNNQQGAATLLTAIVLLVCITLVILMTSKTVLVETQITADNYRTSQATAAASAAMNQGIAYFMQGGMDQDGTLGTIDFSVGSVLSITLATTTAQFYFENRATYDHDNDAGAATPEINNPCDSSPSTFNGTNMTKGMVIAQGWSDDGIATRTISQCLTTFNIFNGGRGPQQPFVSRQSVGIAGNARIINRYSNSSIWSGGSLGVAGASFGTYLRPSGTLISDYDKSELDDADETLDTQEVSDRDSGTGIDVITNDPTLGNKTPAQLFEMFFEPSKSNLRNLAINVDQQFDPGDSLAATPPLTGVVWVGAEGGTPSTTDTTIGGTDILGSSSNPVILIVNGDLKMTGGTVYGVIYVMGELTVTGNPIIKGSLISESGDSSGAGTLNLVYVPYGDGSDNGSGSTPFITGTGAVLTGSWKDW